jgi:hypothetical protein
MGFEFSLQKLTVLFVDESIPEDPEHFVVPQFYY